MLKTKQFTLSAVFLAIILLFAFTPLGFIQLGFIKATFIHIPVILAAIILGPKVGSFLGAVFGLSSIIVNTATPSLISFVFSPAIPVIGTERGSYLALIVALLPRILIGILPYYFYRLIANKTKDLSSKKKNLYFGGIGFLSSLVHTFLVMGLIVLLFKDSYAQALHASSNALLIKGVMTVIMTNGLAEACLSALVISVLAPILLRFQNKNS